MESVMDVDGVDSGLAGNGETKRPVDGIAIPAAARRAFFEKVVFHLRSSLEPDLADFHHTIHGHLVKIHWENERVHYEVAPHSAYGLLEVGLHFEDGPDSTAAYLSLFDRRIVELKHLLGAEIELERWTSSWGRLYYLIDLLPLDSAKAEETAELLSGMIATVQPMVVAAEIRPGHHEARTGPWRSWRRGR